MGRQDRSSEGHSNVAGETTSHPCHIVVLKRYDGGFLSKDIFCMRLYMNENTFPL